MCELFAISSRLPATVSLSLKTLAEHGGGSAPHADGWGIAYYRDGDARVIKDTSAAHDSDWARFVQSRGLSSTTIISHICGATRGGVRLQNTHPFARELGGRMHVLAHNGTLEGVFDHPDFALGRFRPIGETDSEHAFCNLLARLEGLWLSGAARRRWTDAWPSSPLSPPRPAPWARPILFTPMVTPFSSTPTNAITKTAAFALPASTSSIGDAGRRGRPSRAAASR